LNHRGHRGGTEDTEDVLPELSRDILGCAFKVHSALGPGLLESAYEACLCRALSLTGMPFEKQVPVPVTFEGLQLDCGYRLDIVVAQKAIVEVKSVSSLLELHRAQLLTYLRLSGLRLGLLLNFNVRHLRHGIERVVL